MHTENSGSTCCGACGELGDKKLGHKDKDFLGFYFSHKTVLLTLIKINYKNVIRKSTQSKNWELEHF